MGPRGPQAGHHFLRAFPRKLEVQGVRAEINLVAPGNTVSAPNTDLLKKRPVAPGREDTFSREVREIHFPLDSVGVAQPDPESVTSRHSDWPEKIGHWCRSHG